MEAGYNALDPTMIVESIGPRKLDRIVLAVRQETRHNSKHGLTMSLAEQTSRDWVETPVSVQEQ